MRRPPELRRSWLFVGGADEAQLAAAAESPADVIMLELEDFTPPALRPQARSRAPELFEHWRAAGKVAAVRINPLETEDGIPDLDAVMRGRPDAVLLPKVAEPRQVERLDARISHLERDRGIDRGSTELVPNVELARGLIQTYDVCMASERVTACLVGMVWFNRTLNLARVHLRGGKHELVTYGPFTYVRHPLYATLMLTIPPLFVIWMEDLLFLIPWGLIIIACHLAVRLEERGLIEAFGQEYEQYRRFVPMLLPYRGAGSRRLMDKNGQ